MKKLTVLMCLCSMVLLTSCADKVFVPDSMITAIGLPAGTQIEVPEEVLIKLGLSKLLEEKAEIKK